LTAARRLVGCRAPRDEHRDAAGPTWVCGLRAYRKGVRCCRRTTRATRRQDFEAPCYGVGRCYCPSRACRSARREKRRKGVRMRGRGHVPGNGLTRRSPGCPGQCCNWASAQASKRSVEPRSACCAIAHAIAKSRHGSRPVGGAANSPRAAGRVDHRPTASSSWWWASARDRKIRFENKLQRRPLS
jgi:hypothetical protein